MPSDYDATEFIDGDFEPHKAAYATSAAPASQRAPSRQEMDMQVAEQLDQLAKQKRLLEDRQRELAALEETRRRQTEFETGRQEMVQHLTRGLGLLEEAEFTARRDAEQMAKALIGLRDALSKVEAINEETWTSDSLGVELTRGLTTIENARMEWNASRLKFPVLSGPSAEEVTASETDSGSTSSLLAGQSFGQLCRLGFALTWPLGVVGLLALALFAAVLLRR
jgi:hypothetical protein